MSYDVFLEDANGEEVQGFATNATYNLRPMIVEASGGTGPRDWSGKTGVEVADICATILTAFQADPSRFRALNPANGWGSFEGCRAFIREIQDACIDHPTATLRVC